jgi:hypothetical protein
MVMHGAKQTLLNLAAALAGVLAGTWFGRSDMIRSIVERLAKDAPHGEEAIPNRDGVAGETQASPLQDLKEHLQRKEGFRR